MHLDTQRGIAPIFIIIIAIAVVAVGGTLLRSQMKKESASKTAPVKSESVSPLPKPEATTAATAKNETIVTYTAGGFSPETVTIKTGDTVLWKSDGAAMWVGGDEHPTHTKYDGTTLKEHCAVKPSPSFDQCERGALYRFTFLKAGTFKYHNHAQAGHGGVVVVTE